MVVRGALVVSVSTMGRNLNMAALRLMGVESAGILLTRKVNMFKTRICLSPRLVENK